MTGLIFWPAWVKIGNEEHVMAHYFTEKEFMEKFKAFQMAGHDKVFYHYAMGILSNYHTCCIDFFCNVWDNEFFDDLKDKYQFELKRADHIRCPECIIMELNKVD